VRHTVVQHCLALEAEHFLKVAFQVKFICSRIKERRKPRVKIVTLKLE
jgi:hypothetical protein